MVSNVSVAISSVAHALTRARNEGFESASAADVEEACFLAELRRCRSAATQVQHPPGVFHSVDDHVMSLLQTYLAHEAKQAAKGSSLVPANLATAEGYEAKFDNVDPGWIWSLRDWIKKLRKHEFLDAAPGSQEIANDYRLALLSDWGTGLYGAPVCARSIESDKQAIDMVLHLGDIYYAGDTDEVDERFLAHWPQHPGAANRALNGNHEMYTGGNAYFDRILGSAAFAQPASYFALHNEHWLLVGLDTAYAEHDLYGTQTAWLRALADALPGHGILLFSHHQPFSAFESQGPLLQHKLMPLLSTGRVAAWYWGHEHSCVRYDRHPGWKMHGRCIGHSGFPYFRLVKDGARNETRWVRFDAANYLPGGVVLDGPNPYVTENAARYGPNGYVTLDLKGRTVHETYWAPDGDQPLDEFDFEFEAP